VSVSKPLIVSGTPSPEGECVTKPSELLKSSECVTLPVQIPPLKVPVTILVRPAIPQLAPSPGMLTTCTSIKTPWIWMLVVVTAVAVHGNLVATGVPVHLPVAGVWKVQSPPNDPVVISTLCALATREVNDDLVQLEVEPPVAELVNVMFGESST
jgi:hypothetical protein